ncbi:calcium homeostasis modulator protein 6-like [Phascolarctos cinereus]|uniref:Protein FAM26F-like n=1 Tax=Phascolarctos cinereus TaxID=38626 RepID=A0A6P5J1U3_PHACI|nr:protein FAM26F-like [Phascolarctos cinereus]
MEKFHLLLDVLIKHHKAVTMSFWSLLTAGGQTLFSKIVFQCPCDDRYKMPYSLLFFFAPALVLFLLRYLLSFKVGRVVTGCCTKDQRDTVEKIYTLDKKSCKASPETPSKRVMFCKEVVCGQVTLTALLAPFIWITMALLEGNYSVCLFSANEQQQRSLCQEHNCFEKELQMPCQQTSLTNFEQKVRAISQIIGWGLIAGVMVLFTMIKFCCCCTSRVGFLQLQFQKIYMKKENETLTAESKKYATELAERNVKCFFENVCHDSVRIPRTEEWNEISLVIKPSDTEYSKLHKYANNRPVREDTLQNPATDCI